MLGFYYHQMGSAKYKYARWWNKTLAQNGPRKRISLIGGSIRLASFLAQTCIINGHMQNIANMDIFIYLCIYLHVYLFIYMNGGKVKDFVGSPVRFHCKAKGDHIATRTWRYVF
jgi:hypothetical protein